MNGFAMRNTISKTKETAAACYAARHAEAEDLLKRIATRLAEYQTRQAEEPRNWGYAMYMGHITEQLAYVLADLGDRSVVEAKGIDY